MYYLHCLLFKFLLHLTMITSNYFQAEVENLLLERNKYDIQLYQFAQDLVLQRITKLVMDMRSTSFW